MVSSGILGLFLYLPFLGFGFKELGVFFLENGEKLRFNSSLFYHLLILN